MTSSFDDGITRRDDDLVRGLCEFARHSRLDLREWTQAEIKAVLIAAELQEGRVHGTIRESITRVVRRLREIDQQDLREADSLYVDVIEEVRDGGYLEVYEAYEKLQIGSAKYLRIIKELIQIRSFIGEMEDA